MVIKKDISSNEIADRAEGVLSALLNRKVQQNELDTEIPQINLEKWRICCGIIYFVIGIIFITLGILTTVYPITKIIMDDRLKMTPGLPSFELWYKPEPEIILRTYIFNVTNSIEFANGIDKKLKVVEIGPIVYREKLEHTNIVFHDENSTMSYTAIRSTEFIPERNEPGILNKTIIVPNIALLGMASYLQDYLFTIKMGFNIMSRKDSVFLNLTINDYLWNLTTPALSTADKYLPFMTPANNVGPLSIVYKDFKDRVNVNIGKYHGYQDFFKINTYNYVPTVPGFKRQSNGCYASLMNSSEGAIYGQSISKNDIIYYWRKTVCRPIPLYFQKEVKIGKLTGYKFITKSNMYDRRDNNDCYKSFKKMEYPSGLSDASKCYMDLPIGISLPHFYNRTGFWNDKVEGFTPSKEKHTSYAIIEPITGIPLDQCARSQSNLILPKLTGYNSKIIKFSNMVIPMIWLEYHLEKLTPKIDMMLYTVANVLPIGQYFISAGILLFGIYFVIIAVRRLELGNRLKTINNNFIYTFDNEIICGLLTMTGCLPPIPNNKDHEFNMEPSTPISKEEEAHMNDKSNKTLKITFNSNYLYLSLFLTLSIVNLVMGLLSINYSIFDIIMEERIKMRPGFPAMEYWRNPKVKVLVKTYIYAVENSKEFENGIDKKLKLKEIGPIIYEQILTQEDVRFEKNSTLSYTTIRKFRYVDELNEPGIMNKSLIIINPLFIPVASLMNEMPISILLSFDDVFLNRTVYQILWECSTKILDISVKFLPIFVPSNNCGILYQTFLPRPERYNVRIGSENGYEDFWKINTINNKKTLGFYTDNQYSKCPSFTAAGATDGTGYRPNMNTDTIKLATARIPRVFDLDFDGFVQKGRLHAHKYVFSKNNLIHGNDTSRDCLRKSGNFELPDGLIDASNFAYDMPIALSNPHFYGFNGEWENYIEGLSPNEENHSSYLIMEPKTGIPLEAKASLQTNYIVPEIKYITKLKKFSNMIIPAFSMEQVLFKNDKEFEIYLLVNVLPIIQSLSTILFYVLSILFYVKFILKYNQFKTEIKELSLIRQKSFQSIIIDKEDLERIGIV